MRRPPQHLDLPLDEVHLWQASIAEFDPDLLGLHESLSADERARGARFWFDEDRQQFALARGLLRRIVARYQDVDPAAVQFAYSGYGKPSIAPHVGSLPLDFNVSHSGGQVLLAFNRGREIGVDVERIRPLDDLEGLARRYFSAFEQAEIAQTQGEKRREAFFAIWSLKEAVLKARGVGLSYPLDAFWVGPLSAMDDRGCCDLHLRDSNEGSLWSVRKIPTVPGFTAALVVAGHDWRLVHRSTAELLVQS